jgi:hypothetical protein
MEASMTTDVNIRGFPAFPQDRIEVPQGEGEMMIEDDKRDWVHLQGRSIVSRNRSAFDTRR